MAQVTGTLEVTCADVVEGDQAFAYFSAMAAEQSGPGSEVQSVTRTSPTTMSVPVTFPDWLPPAEEAEGS